LRAAVMERDLAFMPNGLDTPIGTRGIRLSGGQAQRAAAARMFVRSPELLVFDDLSSALDVETERALWERIDEGRRTNDQRPTTKDERPTTNDQRRRTKEEGPTTDDRQPTTDEG